jgi:DNA polymerase V
MTARRATKAGWGGRRAGAGRKPGSNRYGEPTRAVRLPLSLHRAVLPLLATQAKTRQALAPEAILDQVAPASPPRRLRLPLFGSKIAAGFPSPADDHVEKRLDLNEHLIRHPEATFFVRVKGESMTGAGIGDGDILVVDRALTPKHRSIVIAVVEGELTVKRLWRRQGRVALLAENPAFPPIEINPETGCEIWGVVLHVIRTLAP